VVLTVIALATGMNLRTVGDMGQLPSTLPVFLFPQVPLNFETLLIILPYAIPLAIVGLLESLMTATIVDDLTDSESAKNTECRGQGIANIVSGFFGGMAGCAMIGQSIINVKSGGRGRLSCFAAGVFLLIMIVVLGDWVGRIPMAALVAVMIMVSIGTFSWASLKNLRTHPKSSSFVMVSTVAVVVFTHNLAWGVGVGVLLSALFFARKVALLVRVSSRFDEAGDHRTYIVEGQLFFVSAGAFSDSFDFREVLQKVTIDVSRAHFWDLSAVGALDKVVLKFRRDGAEVEIIGLNDASATIIDKLAIHDKPGALDMPAGH
jgi:sulfate permease, SulP family